MKQHLRVGAFLREVAVVVIGVLIAVAIGNFAEHRDNVRYLQNTMRAIEGEIKINQTELEAILTRHYEMWTDIEAALETHDDKVSLGELLSNLGGLQVGSLKNVSLRFFVSNKAELVDFDLITTLLDIEAQTEFLSSKIQRLADFSYEHINDTDEQSKRTFALLLSDVIESEESLLESYESLFTQGGLLDAIQ